MERMRSRRGGRAVLVLGLSLMVTVGSLSLGTPADAISNGIGASRPWAAFIYNDDWIPAGAGAPIGRHSTCSGTFVSPRWVLTAAHCVVRGYLDAQGNERPTTIRSRDVTVSADPTLINGEMPVPLVNRYVVDIVLHPDWRPSPIRADLALLHLRSTPGGIDLMPLAPPQPAFDPMTAPWHAFGFGITDPVLGTRLTGSQQRTRVNSYALAPPADCPVGQRCATQVTNLSRLNPGDSGGPWAASIGSPTPDGVTTKLVQFAVSGSATRSNNPAVPKLAVGADLTHAPYHDWIANTANLVLRPRGGCVQGATKIECIVTTDKGEFKAWHVVDGFGHPIPDQATLDCLKARTPRLAVLPLDRFRIQEIPTTSTPARCSASVEILPRTLPPVQQCVPQTVPLRIVGVTWPVPYASWAPLGSAPGNVIAAYNGVGTSGNLIYSGLSGSGGLKPAYVPTGTYRLGVGVFLHNDGFQPGYVSREWSVTVTAAPPGLDAYCVPLPEG